MPSLGPTRLRAGSSCRPCYLGDFIVQRPLQPASGVAAMNASSINTIRIMTLKLDEPAVVSSVIRVGRAGSPVDNMTFRRRRCLRDQPGGRLNAWATDSRDNRVSSIRTTVIASMVRKCRGSRRRGTSCGAPPAPFYFDLASWDVTIDPQCRPTLVEVNLRGQEISFHQVNNGPLFGERTEEVLHHVRGRRQGKETRFPPA